jgi:hypothetical protein
MSSLKSLTSVGATPWARHPALPSVSKRGPVTVKGNQTYPKSIIILIFPTSHLSSYSSHRPETHVAVADAGDTPPLLGCI